MLPEINYWAVILATLSSMIVGSIWYAPKVFGNYWMKTAGVTPSGKMSDATGPIITTLLVSFVTAWVLAGSVFLAWKFWRLADWNFGGMPRARRSRCPPNRNPTRTTPAA